MKDMMAKIELALALIAGISLLVGGIGVMNIMLVSVTERTREIGIRKAIGATNGEIRMQFAVESIIICLIGGFFGIILGALLGNVASAVLGVKAVTSMSSILIAVGVSFAIGIFFGLYPASRAAKLNPIDALRFE
jgi:putative ABC transport system permease protein